MSFKRSVICRRNSLAKGFNDALPSQVIEPPLLTRNFQANALCPNWGQFIFQSANEIANNEKLRKGLHKVMSTVVAEREWWDKRKGQIQTDLLKEVDSEKAASSKAPSVTASEDDAVLVNTPKN